MQQELYPRLSENHQQYLEQQFTAYLGDSRNFAYTPTLLHADVNASHILIDDGRVSGIIDFGDLWIGDPDYDFLYLFDEYDEDFLEKLLVTYRHPDPQRLRRKVKFFALINTAVDSLHAPLAGWKEVAWQLLQRKLSLPMKNS